MVAGSHMDSQPAGGRFDGIFGVLAGLEALEALDAAGIATARPVDLVAWTNEEGGRFAPGAMGSAVFAGALDLESCLGLTDAAGIRFRRRARGDARGDAGAAAAPVRLSDRRLSRAAHRAGAAARGARQQIGVVTGIQGARWYVVEVTGEPAMPAPRRWPPARTRCAPRCA